VTQTGDATRIGASVRVDIKITSQWVVSSTVMLRYKLGHHTYPFEMVLQTHSHR
jgi:hypothetical protein